MAAPRTRELLMVGAVLLVAVLLRLPSLGQASLWLDEMWSIATSRLSWPSLLSVVLHEDSNASLYYALLHVWMHLGTSEASVRLLSVLVGVATAWAVYLLGRRLAGARVGLVASLLVAVNGFHIQYSQEARSYSLVVLLVTLSTLFFVKSIEEPTWRNWGGYILTSALAIYGHVFAVLVLASHWSSLPLLRRREVFWRRLLASAGAIGVLVLPVAILLLARMREPMPPLSWAPKPSLRLLAGLFWLFSGNTNYLSDPSDSDALRGAPLLATYFGVCIAALVCAANAWRNSGRSLQTWRLGLPLSWLFVPIALTFAISFLKPVFVSKYLLVCLPPMTLLAAIGVQSLARRWLRVAAAVAVVSLALAALPRYYNLRSRNHEWRAATDHLLSRARPGDAIIFFVAPGRLLFDYYRRASAGAAAGIDIPYPGFEDGDEGPETLAYLPPVRRDLVERVVSHHRRVWLVLFHHESPSAAGLSHHLQGSLAATYRETEEIRFEGNRETVMVLLYERPH
jgi:mannosyltransferase